MKLSQYMARQVIQIVYNYLWNDELGTPEENKPVDPWTFATRQEFDALYEDFQKRYGIGKFIVLGKLNGVPQFGWTAKGWGTRKKRQCLKPTKSGTKE